MSANQRYKCSPVTGNGDSSQIAEKLLRRLQTNKQTKQCFIRYVQKIYYLERNNLRAMYFIFTIPTKRFFLLASTEWEMVGGVIVSEFFFQQRPLIIC
jgi:hypothetical protein